MRKSGALVISLVSLAGCTGAHHAAPVAPPRYALLNPILFSEGVQFTELKPFEYKVRKLITEAKKAKRVDDVALYYRDLGNGPTFGFEADAMFSPASLMKVPLMMAVLKEAQTKPALLSQRIRNDQPELGRSDFDTHPLKRGEEYTVDELLRVMIGASDNDAVVMLRTVVGDGPLNDVFRDFGLLIPEVRSLDDSMTAREYSTFFRILYNASYLDRNMSQKALQYLSAAQFKQGLVAGIPPGVVVAHKFGERSFTDKNTKQLHDCGIVYHHDDPYVLCIMTRGDDFENLSGVIRDISKLVYDEVEAQ